MLAARNAGDLKIYRVKNSQLHLSGILLCIGICRRGGHSEISRLVAGDEERTKGLLSNNYGQYIFCCCELHPKVWTLTPALTENVMEKIATRKVIHLWIKQNNNYTVLWSYTHGIPKLAIKFNWSLVKDFTIPPFILFSICLIVLPSLHTSLSP